MKTLKNKYSSKSFFFTSKWWLAMCLMKYSLYVITCIEKYIQKMHSYKVCLKRTCKHSTLSTLVMNVLIRTPKHFRCVNIIFKALSLPHTKCHPKC
jgi:hypothetical protein